MEPRQFAEVNFRYAGKSYGNLPAQRDGEQVLTCWSMSWRERFAAVVFGRVWLCVHGDQQPPVWMRCERDCHAPTPPAPESVQAEER